MSTLPQNRPRSSLLSPQRIPAQLVDCGRSTAALRLTVVSTTIPATLAALRRAGELAYELSAQIRLLIPQVVPYPLPLDRPSVAPDFTARHFRTICRDGTVETTIEVRLCRDAYEAIAHDLCPESLIVIGGQKRWWFTAEHRLARKLTLAGHHVLFVPGG